MAELRVYTIDNPMEMVGLDIVPVRAGEDFGYIDRVQSVAPDRFYLSNGFSLPYFYTEEKVSYYTPIPEAQVGSMGSVYVSDCYPINFSGDFQRFIYKYKK